MSGLEEVFAPGLRHWQEHKDFAEDDAHHLVAEGDPFADMLDKGAVVIRGVRAPRDEDDDETTPKDDVAPGPDDASGALV